MNPDTLALCLGIAVGMVIATIAWCVAVCVIAEAWKQRQRY